MNSTKGWEENQSTDYNIIIWRWIVVNFFSKLWCFHTWVLSNILVCQLCCLWLMYLQSKTAKIYCNIHQKESWNLRVKIIYFFPHFLWVLKDIQINEQYISDIRGIIDGIKDFWRHIKFSLKRKNFGKYFFSNPRKRVVWIRSTAIRVKWTSCELMKSTFLIWIEYLKA